MNFLTFLSARIDFTLARFVFRFSALCLFALIANTQASDAEVCSPGQPGCVAIGKWEFKLGIGAGIRDNPLVEGEDIPLYLLPDASYYGERFFFDTYIGGFTFVDHPSFMVNGIVTISFDQLYFNNDNIGRFAIESGPLGYKANDESGNVNSDEKNVVDDEELTQLPDGSFVDPETNEPHNADEIIIVDRLHKRETALLGGIELVYFPGRWEVSFQYLRDMISVYSGDEVRFAVSRFMTIGDEHFEVASGLTWQDRKTMDYFWGVRESEVENPALAYHADSGTSPFIRLDWRRHLIGNWSLQTTVHHRWLSNEVKNSPLVGENAVLTAFIGGVYQF